MNVGVGVEVEEIVGEDGEEEVGLSLRMLRGDDIM